MRSLVLLLVVGVLACDATAQKSPLDRPLDGVTVSEFATGLENPWGLAFLPDGRALVTEKPGRLRFLSPDGTLSEPLAGMPKVDDGGQGGLLDVALDPDFATNRLVYLSFSEPGTDDKAGTAVAKGRLGERGLEDVVVIYRQEPKVKSGGHYGSRLVFGRADDGDAGNRVGDRHERRVERVADVPNDLEPHEAGEREDDKVAHEA